MHLALPAQVGAAELEDAVDQEPLEIELLQVDEGRLLGAAFVLQVEGVELVGAGEGAADRPGDALGADPLVDAQPLEDLEALLRIADAARRRALDADGVVVVEQHRAHAAQGEVAGQRQAGQAGAGDDDGIADAVARREIGRRHERPVRQLVAGAKVQVSAVMR